MDSYIYYVFILKNLFQNLFGTHYPIEIVTLIILILYKPIKVITGANHTILISDKTYVWGYNNYGQLGLGDYMGRNSPNELPLHNIKLISCGHSHTVALIEHGQLYVWGYNKSGELGLGDCGDRESPTEMRFYPMEHNRASRITSIVCGGFHTIVLTFSNKIYTWGSNWAGQLGLGDNYARLTPQELILENIKSVSCGVFHTIALTCYGTLYVWGQNGDGQLGLGDYDTRLLPQKLNFPLSNIKSVICSCTVEYTIVLTLSNFFYSWGKNSYGQLGLGDKKKRNVPCKIEFSDIQSIHCGRYHTVVATTQNIISPGTTMSNLLYVWGKNNYDISDSGNDKRQLLSQKLILDNVGMIVCGEDYTIAITNTNDVYVWGDNGGQLGLGDYQNHNLPQLLEFKF